MKPYLLTEMQASACCSNDRNCLKSCFGTFYLQLSAGKSVQAIEIGYMSNSTWRSYLWHSVAVNGNGKIISWHIVTSVLDVSEMMQRTRLINTVIERSGVNRTKNNDRDDGQTHTGSTHHIISWACSLAIRINTISHILID